MRHFVVFLGDGCSTKGIGFNQITTGSQIAFMDIANDIGPRQAEQLVVALHIFGEIRKTLATVLRLIELEALDHRSHCAIQNGNPAFKNGWQRLRTRIGSRFHGTILRCFISQFDIQPIWNLRAMLLLL